MFSYSAGRFCISPKPGKPLLFAFGLVCLCLSASAAPPKGKTHSKAERSAQQMNLPDPGNKIQSIRLATLRHFRPAGVSVEGGVEIAVHSSEGFPVINEGYTLKIGDQSYIRSRYQNRAALDVLIFFIPSGAFDHLPDGVPVMVQHGRGGSGRTWRFGALKKQMLHR